MLVVLPAPAARAETITVCWDGLFQPAGVGLPLKLAVIPEWNPMHLFEDELADRCCRVQPTSFMEEVSRQTLS